MIGDSISVTGFFFFFFGRNKHYSRVQFAKGNMEILEWVGAFSRRVAYRVLDLILRFARSGTGEEASFWRNCGFKEGNCW